LRRCPRATQNAESELSLHTQENVFRDWLEKYGRAWKSCDAHAAATLFADDGSYQVTPFAPPMRGQEAILEYWHGVCETERNIQFGFEILAVTGETGVARWWVSFLIVPQQLDTKLDGVLVITLDRTGRCSSFREWWHKEQRERAGK
jgi:SnoaL-like protein